MTLRCHVTDFYMDGHIAISYCKVCSVEGDKLFEECKGPIDISTERCKIARHMNLSDDCDTWPLKIIDGLIELEKREGEEKLFAQIRKLNGVRS